MSDGLNSFSTVVTTLAAVVAVFIAWMGLSTWKAQIKWQTDHDLARRLLMEIYRFRDAVSAARNPFIWADEMREESDTTTSRLPSAKETHAGLMRAFQRRFSEIGKSGPQIYALVLEARAVWGPELSIRWKRVNRLQNELSTQTQLFLEYSDPAHEGADPTAFYSNKEEREAARLVVYSIGEEDGKNDFSNRFASAIAEVENYLEPKLGRLSQ